MTNTESKKIVKKSTTASRKFNPLHYASWLPLSWYHYVISQTVSAKSEKNFFNNILSTAFQQPSAFIRVHPRLLFRTATAEER
jgi:hypothetical protein